jgi:uncharacterized protein (TIGR03435 family)
MALTPSRGFPIAFLVGLVITGWGLLMPPATFAAETGLVEIGGLVPGLEVEEMLEGPGPEGLSEALGSEAVVLEMWATWCAPCIAAIKDWNEMVEELAGAPVRFVSITDEESERVRRLLERKPIAGWVALDGDRSIFDTFGVHGIPSTIFIDAEGRFQGMSHPNGVTVDTVQALVAGEPLGLPERSWGEELRVDPEGQPKALYEVSLRPTTIEGRQGSVGPGLYEGEGYPVEWFVAYAWDVPRTRLALETELPEQRYDLRVRTGGKGQEEGRAAARLLLQSVFGLETATERREREVWLLTRLPDAESKLKPAVIETGFSYGHGRVTALSITVGYLAEVLEGLLGKPVLDETGLEGKWEVELEWDEGESQEASLLAAVRETLGLELKPAVREVEVTVVRRRDEATEADGQD